MDPFARKSLQASNPARQTIWDWFTWWGPLLIISLCKLWIVAGDDPIGQSSDAWGYADTARKLVWGEGYRLPNHPSGFPFIAGLAAQLGLPWRFTLEIFFLLASCGIARALRALTNSRITAVLVFGFLAWHPWPLSGFRDFMADPFLLVVLTALVATAFEILSEPTQKWKTGSFIWFGALLFIWAWARQEGVLLFASYVVFLLLALIVIRVESRHSTAIHQRWLRLGTLLLLPLLISFGLHTTVKVIMWQRCGIYAKSLLDSPGVTSLMKALYTVKPEKDLPFAPVTHQSLKAACDASPTLNQFAASLLDPNNPLTVIGTGTTKLPGEFGPCLIWLLPYSVESTLRSNSGTNAAADGLRTRQTADKNMRQAAREIHQAVKQGRLPKRTAWFPLDPNYRIWLPGLPKAVWTWLGHGTLMSPPGEPWGTWHNPILQEVFDEAATRRALNQYPKAILGSGALQGTPGVIDSVAVFDHQGTCRAASVVFGSNWWDQGQAFDLRFPINQESLNFRLAFLRSGKAVHNIEFSLNPTTGEVMTAHLSPTIQKHESDIKIPETGQTISYDFSAKVTDSSMKLRRERCENLLGKKYKPLLCAALIAAFLCTMLQRPWESPKLLAATLCFLLVAGWFSLRGAFYGLIDVTMGFQAVRYMHCVSPLFILILFLATILFAAFLRKSLLPILVHCLHRPANSDLTPKRSPESTSLPS